ncbi:MAG: hypothetical protein Q7U91_08915 [Sideroxyarcus sp.]|nr:hypothetical protein [Sideroxyarcus sp.]
MTALLGTLRFAQPTTAVGGVRIRVPAARAAEAREVIAAYHRGDYALSEDDDSYRE